MITAVHVRALPRGDGRSADAASVEVLYVWKETTFETLALLVLDKGFEGLVAGALAIEDSDTGVQIRVPNQTERLGFAFSEIVRIYRDLSSEERRGGYAGRLRLVVGKAPLR